MAHHLLADVFGWSSQHATAIALRERGGITDELVHVIQRELELQELGLG